LIIPAGTLYDTQRRAARLLLGCDNRVRESAMKRDTVIRELANHRREMCRRFAIRRLALFGSTARDDASDQSDIDMLVVFEGPATLRAYMGLKQYIEDVLHCPVDLVTEQALREELRGYVEKDLVDVA